MGIKYCTAALGHAEAFPAACIANNAPQFRSATRGKCDVLFVAVFVVNIQKPGVIVFGGSSLCKFLWVLVTSPVSVLVSFAGCLMLLQGEGGTDTVDLPHCTAPAVLCLHNHTWD